MASTVKSESVNVDLRKDIESLSGQKLNACYLCGKCSAGCPVAPFQDVPPHVVMRLAQMGNSKLLETTMIWNCVSCGTCYTRCPNDVDPAKVCEAAARIAKQHGIVASKAAQVLREKFVESVKNNGRVHELALAVQLKMVNGDLFGDIGMGLPMLLKGKLPVFSHQIENLKEFQKLFENEHEEEHGTSNKKDGEKGDK